MMIRVEKNCGDMNQRFAEKFKTASSLIEWNLCVGGALELPHNKVRCFLVSCTPIIHTSNSCLKTHAQFFERTFISNKRLIYRLIFLIFYLCFPFKKTKS